ncbi:MULTISPECIES: TetR/AcrR family transcriptional regulator [Glycomyces]|jgi:AcrR family transcriptional regulator|uniref:AcrR family transcriptional regulator n=2 Tax=Glycomyces TaxID=58113 RepID=A0A9X3SXM5_9ACTN|nr:TetR/AcrR family transcriptional regulator [Glycomyces lechevalierae]MDA1387122.1 TetR/AcrR family transcriptional regulator [Glycomyces lechevalierae]MDR7336740.1 AcrR family transcriptional regulator [Glycomyces lechevalierae]
MSSKREQPPGPGRPRDPEADAAILRAAMEILVEQGVAGASIDRIAKRANVAKVTVYRRWSAKEDLLADAIEAVREEIPAADETDRPAEDLHAIIDQLLPQWSEALVQPRLRVLTARLLSAGPDHPKLLDAYREHHVKPRRERALATLRRARDTGILDPDSDLDMLIDMMNGAIIQFVLLAENPIRPAEAREYLTRLFRQAGLHE